MADHSLSRNSYDRDGVVTAPGQPRSRAADGGAGAAREIADHLRWLEVRARQPQRVRGEDVKPRQPDTRLTLAALGDHLREEIELGERVIETHPNDRETPLHLGCGRAAGFALEPSQVSACLLAQLVAAADEKALDGDQRGRREPRGRQHRLLQRERFHTREPC